MPLILNIFKCLYEIWLFFGNERFIDFFEIFRKQNSFQQKIIKINHLSFIIFLFLLLNSKITWRYFQTDFLGA